VGIAFTATSHLTIACHFSVTGIESCTPQAFEGSQELPRWCPPQGHVFHNRLTHSLQVAQVGRRIAEKLLREANSDEIAIDPDVVEAACLAHDIGHPPFGHIAEQEMDSIARQHGVDDGFEGNAQSFRIVTRLAMGSTDNGLNLTRATLNAVLKYPWLHGKNAMKPDKWGAYDSDKDLFA